MRWLALLLLLSLFTLAMAQTEPKVRPLPLANDALAVAVTHLATVPAPVQQYMRYLWVPDGDLEAMQAVSLTLNSVSNAAGIYRPIPLKRGPVLVLAVDLRSYAPQQDGKHDDLARLVRVWEEFRFDPQLSTILTGDVIRLAAQQTPNLVVRARQPRWELVPSAPYVHEGVTYNQRWIIRGYEDTVLPIVDAKDVTLVSFISDDVDSKLYEALSATTHSQAPLVSSPYFHYRALAAIKDEQNKLWATIFGGLYYDLLGVGTGFRKGSDLDNLISSLGVGDVEKGLGYEQVFEQFRSDQKLLKFHSDVTDGPREVDVVPILGGSAEAVRLVRITNDLKHANVDIGVHPAMNLFRHKPDAHEVIWGLRNRLLGKALFNGAGVRQNEAPPDVATDWTVRRPRHPRLQPGISCISCHEAEGSDGFRRVANDATALFKRLDVLADLTRYGRSFADLQDRLRAYKGNVEAVFNRGRDDYAAAVLEATGPWKRSTKGQSDAVKIAATKQVEMWRDFEGTVDPQQALRELGVEVAKDDALAVLKKLLPPDKAGAVTYLGLPEDARLAALLEGVSITRADWALVRGFAAGRAKRTLAELLNKK